MIDGATGSRRNDPTRSTKRCRTTCPDWSCNDPSAEVRGVHHAIPPDGPVAHGRTGIRHGAGGRPGPAGLRDAPGSANITPAATSSSPARRCSSRGAERTKHIRLGTGVVSLPYHHPPMVADRWVPLTTSRGAGSCSERPGCAAVGRLHDGHRSRRAAADDAGVAGGDPGAVPGRARGTDRSAFRLVLRCATPSCISARTPGRTRKSPRPQ